MDARKKLEKKLDSYFPVPGLQVGLWQTENEPAGELHGHHFIELAIIMNGHGIHQFEESALHVGTGDVFIINPGCQHAWVETHDMDGEHQ